MHFQHLIIDPEGPHNPHIKALGDIDGDGELDVVVSSSSGGPLVWYRYPDWDKHVVAGAGKWSCDAQIVDMDGDGDGDILISDWYEHDRLEWWENPLPHGDPARDPWKHHLIGPPRAHDIQVGDIDGDGRLEIITRTQGADGDRIHVRRQGDDGVWTQSFIPCPAGEGLALGDLDGDGRAEIVIADRFFEAPADLLTDPWPEHRFAEWPSDCVVQLADMNGDGRLDIVLTRSEGKHRLSWFEAPADPRTASWTERVVDDSVDYAHSLQVVDLDGDGRLDIVTAEMHQSERRRVMVYQNRGGATHWARQVVATTGSHKLCAARMGGEACLVGVNWSGEYQPVEMWRAVVGNSPTD